MQLAPEENVRVDLTSAASAAFYPMVKLLLWTGLCWMGIGWLDGHGYGLDQGATAADNPARSILLVFWVLVVCWQFIGPVVGLRRRRIVVTDQRIVLRDAGVRTRTGSIPLGAVRQISRKRRTIRLGVAGIEQPIELRDVPKAKRVVAAIERGIYHAHGG